MDVVERAALVVDGLVKTLNLSGINSELRDKLIDVTVQNLEKE